MMPLPPNADLIGGVALLAAALIQAVNEPVPVPESIGGWVIFILVTLGLGGVGVWAIRRKIEDYFAEQLAEREADKEDRDAHRKNTDMQIERLREDVASVAAQRDSLITEVMADLRADRDFYRNAFMEERKRADACHIRLDTPA